MANSYVDLSGLDSPYAAQLNQIQRQQRMADLLRQQLDEPIPVQQGGGAPAPISWGSVLAKALNGVGASMKENRAQQMLQALGQQDSDSAQALIKSLQGTPQTFNTPGMPAQQTAIDGTAQAIPGAPAPSPVMAQGTIPGMDATSQTITQKPDADARLAMILAARGGPQTQMIQNAMLGRENTLFNNDLDWQNTLKKNTLPMSTAAQQELTAQGQQAWDLAQKKNLLPMTAAEQAADARARATNQETRRYHDMLAGGGVTEDGQTNPIVQSYTQNILAGNMNMQNVPQALRGAVSMAMTKADKQQYSPVAQSKMTLASSRITQPYTNMAGYKLTADGLPYLQRIDAAMKHPGSVSDQDLLDSLTKLNTGGNAVTEAQVALITGHGSLADWAGTLANKVKNGGALSDNQRKQIKDIANDIFANYRKGYQPIYEEATGKLKAAGVPEAFWTIPDLNKLNAGQAQAGGGDKKVVRTGVDKATGKKVVQYSDGTIADAP